MNKMWVRYKISTKQFIALSEPPFTLPLMPDEADVEFPPGTVLPGPASATLVDLVMLKLIINPAWTPPPNPNLALKSALDTLLADTTNTALAQKVKAVMSEWRKHL